jgi:hypothetical protein
LVEVCNPTSTKAVLMEAMNKHLLNKWRQIWSGQ